MNYRELLKKYIAHVYAEEGCDFIENGGMGQPNFITKEEWDELEKLSSELEEYND